MLLKLPTLQEDLDLDGYWKDTLAGERFLLCDSRKRILVVSINDHLKNNVNLTLLFSYIFDHYYYASML